MALEKPRNYTYGITSAKGKKSRGDLAKWKVQKKALQFWRMDGAYQKWLKEVYAKRGPKEAKQAKEARWQRLNLQGEAMGDRTLEQSRKLQGKGVSWDEARARRSRHTEGGEAPYSAVDIKNFGLGKDSPTHQFMASEGEKYGFNFPGYKYPKGSKRAGQTEWHHYNFDLDFVAPEDRPADKKDASGVRKGSLVAHGEELAPPDSSMKKWERTPGTKGMEYLGKGESGEHHYKDESGTVWSTSKGPEKAAAPQETQELAGPPKPKRETFADEVKRRGEGPVGQFVRGLSVPDLSVPDFKLAGGGMIAPTSESQGAPLEGGTIGEHPTPDPLDRVVSVQEGLHGPIVTTVRDLIGYEKPAHGTVGEPVFTGGLYSGPRLEGAPPSDWRDEVRSAEDGLHGPIVRTAGDTRAPPGPPPYRSRETPGGIPTENWNTEGVQGFNMGAGSPAAGPLATNQPQVEVPDYGIPADSNWNTEGVMGFQRGGGGIRTADESGTRFNPFGLLDKPTVDPRWEAERSQWTQMGVEPGTEQPQAQQGAGVGPLWTPPDEAPQQQRDTQGRNMASVLGGGTPGTTPGTTPAGTAQQQAATTPSDYETAARAHADAVEQRGLAIGELAQARYDKITAAELAKAKIAEKKAAAAAEWETAYRDRRRAADYPGMALSEIKKNEDLINTPAPAWMDPEQRRKYELDQALAERKLRRAQEIDPGRGFGNIFAKLLASLSVGLGTYASHKTGQNPALELFNQHIAQDIAAQKSAFEHRRGMADASLNDYSFFMDRYDDEEVAAVNAAALASDKAITLLQGKVDQTAAGVEKEKILAAMEGFKYEQGIKIQKAAALAEAKQLKAEQALTTPFRGIKRKPGAVGWEKFEADALDAWSAVKVVVEIAEQIEGLVSGKGGWVPEWDEDKRSLESKKKALLAAIAKANELGVMQQFEMDTTVEAMGHPGAFYDWALRKLGTKGMKSFAKGFREAGLGGMRAKFEGNDLYTVTPGSQFHRGTR